MKHVLDHVLRHLHEIVAHDKEDMRLMAGKGQYTEAVAEAEREVESFVAAITVLEHVKSRPTEPLRLGDRFGDFEVVEFCDEPNTGLCHVKQHRELLGKDVSYLFVVPISLIELARKA